MTLDRKYRALCRGLRGGLPEGLFPIRELKADFFAHTWLVGLGGSRLVLKVSRFGTLSVPILRPLEEFLSRRERRAYELLQGVAGIPALHAAAGDNFFLHEFVRGETLSRRADVDEKFLDEFELLIRRVHDRGVALLDISKRENILVDACGRPCLLDFQISFLRGPGVVRDYIFRHSKATDLFHAFKRRRFLRKRLGLENPGAGRRAPWTVRVHRRLVRKPWLLVKRLFSAKGSGERRAADQRPLPRGKPHADS